MIDVSAAIIYDGEGRILICQRQNGGSCANRWEFPGGKREAGETMEECLIRECREELGVRVELRELYAELNYAYPDREIHFKFFTARVLDGTARLNVHRDMCWVEPARLLDFDFCPADAGLVRRLAAEK